MLYSLPERSRRQTSALTYLANTQWCASNNTVIRSREGCDSCKIFFAASSLPTTYFPAPSLLCASRLENSHCTQCAPSLHLASLLLKEGLEGFGEAKEIVYI